MKLSDQVTAIKGIGPKTAALLANIGIITVQQLLDYYPFRYEDRTYSQYDQLIDGENITLKGIIYNMPQLIRRGKKAQVIINLIINDNKKIKVIWFNQAYLINNLRIDQSISVTGKYSAKYNHITALKYQFNNNDTFQIHTGTIVPIYSRCYQVSSEQFRKWINLALEALNNTIDDLLPQPITTKYKLISKEMAYKWIHFPQSSEQCKQAYRRLVFEEFFFYQLKLQLYRNNYKLTAKDITRRYDRRVMHVFIDQLDFLLTSAQERVISELLIDIEKSQPMYRLLHGDVGSGKTIVATILMVANWTSKFQSVLMVPTEILAEQHFQTIIKYTKELGIKICLLKGGISKKERVKLIAAIKQSDIDIVIGTHALLQDDVEFANLGLVIIDEQHRFGVEQRAILSNKGYSPDILTMSATPIPRTMALTIFGDIDISVLDELPNERRKVKTEWYEFNKERLVFQKILEILMKHQQVYIVCPMIEESDNFQVNNVQSVFLKINEQFANYRVGILHGRLSNIEKDDIMQQFINHKIDILVTTTVIEVGVNVPNASVIVVYNAERFGLTQLHQLRGRVGRANYQGYCYLLAEAKSDISKQRIQVLVDSNDGFYIAEKDLVLRGPGEILGNRQSGLPTFKLGNLIEDYKIMLVARDEAKFWVNNTEYIQYINNINLGINFLA